MRAIIRQPAAIPVILLLAGAYGLGTAPGLAALATVLPLAPVTASCGCAGDRGDCCGASCCAIPETPVASCCSEAPPARPGPAWDAACTCGDRAHHGATVPGCDRHLPADTNWFAPAPLPADRPAPAPTLVLAPDLDSDDPVPRPASGPRLP